MSNNYLRNVLSRYIAALVTAPAVASVSIEDLTPCRADPSIAEHYDVDRVRHLLWMISQILESLDRSSTATAMSSGKIMRWVSFIQGALWTMGVLPVDKARVDNYTILNGTEPPTT